MLRTTLRMAALGLAVTAMSSCGAIKSAAIKSVANTLSEGGTAVTSHDDPELVADALPFALKLYESMASGVPVIVPERAGSATTVREHDSGMIVPPDDATAVAVAVAALAADPVRAAQMGRRGRAAVEAHYSWSVRARATAAVLDTVLERSV